MLQLKEQKTKQKGKNMDYRKRGRKSKKPKDFEKFIEEYKNEELTLEELAVKYKVKVHTLHNWIYEYKTKGGD